MPQISVIVPVYKTEKYLKICIDSILNQTFSDLEVILVEDGSPDLSGKICDEYAEKDRRVKVIHQKNKGVASARNTGMDHAVGKYMTFVDSDDFLAPQMYEKMMQFIRKYNCDLVICDCIKVNSDGRETIYSHNIRGGYYSEEQLYKEYYQHLMITPNMEYPATISNWLCLFRNKKEELPRYEPGIRYSEDWLFGCQLMLQMHSFYYMKGENLYYYRMNDQSATHIFVPDKWVDYQILYSKFKDIMQQHSFFDFSEQVNRVLLFFVYNAVGELLKIKKLSRKEKQKKIGEILGNQDVKKMFRMLRPMRLNVSFKLKLLTVLYKYRCINILLIIAIFK